MSGEFICTIHDNAVHKSRIMIPHKFRAKIAPDANNTVVVTLGPKGTIAIFPMDSWKMMRKQLLARPEEKFKKLLANLFNFAMPEQTIEGPGRIRISEELMKKAKIKDSVSIKGEGHFMSVWNAGTLNEILDNDYEEHSTTYDSQDYLVNDLS